MERVIINKRVQILSLCPGCYCMTKTHNQTCLKCMAKKNVCNWCNMELPEKPHKEKFCDEYCYKQQQVLNNACAIMIEETLGPDNSNEPTLGPAADEAYRLGG